MSRPEYTASINNERFNCVAGRGKGLGYYAHYLNESLSCRDLEEAERAAKIANIASEAAYKQAQHDMRKVLGL